MTNPLPVATASFETMTPNWHGTVTPLGMYSLSVVSSTSLPPALAVAHLLLFRMSSQPLVRSEPNLLVVRRTILPLPEGGRMAPSEARTLKPTCPVLTEALTAHVPPVPIHASWPESVPLA